jgi:phospholipid/cholesterol/gamma-HCH transport system permease protein
MSYAAFRNRVNMVIDGIWYWFLRKAEVLVLETGQLFNFGVRSVRFLFYRPYRFEELVVHMDFIGNQSISIISLSGIFTGMALALQIYLGFKIVNATSLVGPTVALGIFRELGPVLTGLIVAARAGGAMAARIGSMQVTEQIDALEVMGVEPIQYLVSPRVLAAVIVMPLLTGVFDFISMVGCWLISVHLLDLDEAAFWDRIHTWVQPFHIFEGLFKAAVFGLAFAVICTHRGYTTKGGAEGVGEATNRGVVLSMVMIIILDFFVTNLINVFYAVKDQLFS